MRLHASLDSKSELTEILGADVVFDVTRLDVSERVIDFGIANGIPVVSGTSGWTEAKLGSIGSKLAAASNSGASVTIVPNFSVGSTLATKFASVAATYFDSIEIIEAHHAGKVDSPSGTAIRTAELISKARQDASRQQPLIPGVGQIARGEVVAGVPIHSLRLSGVSAKQEVLLGGNEELLTISHEVTSVRSYSAGILASIRFGATSTGLTVGLAAVMGI
jgi:4-hydroxy-tetrahydrodipicolinate reductase